MKVFGESTNIFQWPASRVGEKDGRRGREEVQGKGGQVFGSACEEWPNAFQKLLLKKVVEAHEVERRRIAQDIHDEVEQLLGNAIFRLDMCLLQLNGAVEESKEKDLQKVRDILVESVSSLQHLSHSLRPALLDHLGLEAALAWFFRTSGIKDSVNLHWRVVGLQDRLPPEVEITVFRIIQESCNNILKHSRAKNVSVEAKVQRGRINVTITDDGIGFDPGAIMARYCAENDAVPMGLSGMKERAELLGGKLNLSSGPQRGTKIFVEIPLDSQAVEVMR